MNLYLKIILFYLPLLITTLILGFINKKIKWYFWILAIFTGMLAIIPTVAIQFLFNLPKSDSLFMILLTCLLMNGITEEFCKGACSMLMLPKKHDFMQFFLLCLISGLSFGTFENVIYLISGTKNVELRMVTAMLIHVICASLDGMFVWALFQKKFRIRPLISSIFVHGLYNFFANLPGYFKLLLIVILLYGIFDLILLVQIYARDKSESKTDSSSEEASSKEVK